MAALSGVAGNSRLGCLACLARWAVHGALTGLFQPVVLLRLFVEYEDALSRAAIRARCPPSGVEMENFIDICT